MHQLATLFALALATTGPRSREPVPAVERGAGSALSRSAEEAARTKGLAGHLAAWEEKTTGLANARAEIALTRFDNITKKKSSFGGLVLCVKPDFAVLRLNNADDPTKSDYEAYICNKEAVYVYNGVAKTVTEFKRPLRLPEPFHRAAERASVELTLGFSLLTGVKARDLQERFDITLFKTDENYLYLDLKPRSERDRAAFLHLRLALYGPGLNTSKIAYLPAQVYILKRNGDTEVWKFTNPQVNIPGLEPKHFQRVEIKEPGWTHQNADGPVPPNP